MNIVKNNISSPFKLRRSMVDHGGAYETGNFDPNSYNGSGFAAAAAIEGFGKVAGAALSSLTEGDINKIDVNREKSQSKNLEKLKDKQASKDISESKKARITKRISKKENNLNETRSRIEKYNTIYGKN